LNASRAHPDTDINWTQFVPISGIPAFPTANKIPYTEEYMLSLERQIGAGTMLSASYVGTSAHRLLVLIEANPGNPTLCLGLSRPNDVSQGSATCGPFGENNVFTTATGQVVHGTRGPLGQDFGSDTDQATIGSSNYNALEVGLRHTGPSYEYFLAYTYGKSMDDSSNIGEEVNPIDPSISYALSAFDIKHNFVASYEYQLPIGRLVDGPSSWAKGWELSGITRFSTGFPVTLLNYGDNSLLGSQPNGVNNYGVDEPQYTPGPLNLNHNPRKAGHNYFNVSLFSMQPLGTPGNAKRRFFYGPGQDNYDMALLKGFPLRGTKSVQFRLEGFNIFDHAQFYGPASVDGNINSSTFGQVINAAPPRILQAAAKFLF
jgi:hypothetical protein